MVSRPVVYGLLAFLAFRGFSKASAAREFNYGLEGLPEITYTGGNGVITFHLSVSNPSGETFNVQKVQADVFINTQFVGNMVSTSQFTIPAYGTAKVALILTVYLTNAALSLIRALTTKAENGVAVLLKGAVSASGVNVPIEYTKKF